MILQPSECDIRTRAGQNWLNRGGEHGSHEVDWILAETQLFMELNYERFDRDFINTKKISLNATGDPICRYCDLKRGDHSKIIDKKNDSPYKIRFGKWNSHTVPTFLGNRKLYSNDECKVCNEIVMGKYEGDLKTYMSPMLSIEGIRGRTANKPISVTDGKVVTTATYRPEWIQKALVKMAIANICRMLSVRAIRYFRTSNACHAGLAHLQLHCMLKRTPRLNCSAIYLYYKSALFLAKSSSPLPRTTRNLVRTFTFQ